MMMRPRFNIDLTIGHSLLLLLAATFLSFETTTTTTAFSLLSIKKKPPPLLRLLPLGPSIRPPQRIISSSLPPKVSYLSLHHAAPASVSASSSATKKTTEQLSKWQSLLVRLGMMIFVAGMCVSLPATLLPQRLLYKVRLITKTQKEMLAVRTAQFWARFLLRWIPFCRIEALPGSSSSSVIDDDDRPPPLPQQPAIWVCNHTSMFDLFVLCAADKKARGDQRRPIKVVYRKALEANPLSRLFFRQAGFIPIVQIVDDHGNVVVNNDANSDSSYDVSSFKQFVKDCKFAFKEGFDVGVMPEGRINPNTDKGTLPALPGAFSLAKMSKRPIRFMALYGVDQLWHCHRGMVCRSRHVKVRCYPDECYFQSPEQFTAAFANVVGNFGKLGKDLPAKELEFWLQPHQQEVSHNNETRREEQ